MFFICLFLSSLYFLPFTLSILLFLLLNILHFPRISLVLLSCKVVPLVSIFFLLQGKFIFEIMSEGRVNSLTLQCGGSWVSSNALHITAKYVGHNRNFKFVTTRLQLNFTSKLKF